MEKTQDIATELNQQEVVVIEPKKRKHAWIGMIFLLLIIGFGIFLMFKITDLTAGDNLKNFGEAFGSIDVKYLLISIFIAVLIPVLVMVEYGIVTRAVTGKVRKRVMTKTTLLGKYYDFITPFSTGSQPMQIHYLHKHKYSGAESSAIIFIRYSINIVCWLIVGITLMFVGYSTLSSISNNTSRLFLLIAGIIGIVANLLFPLLVLIFVIAPKFANKLTGFVVKLGAKLKIVKNPEKTLEKAHKTVYDFRMCFRTMAKKPVHFTLLVLLSIFEYFITFALPFFVIKSFTPLGWNRLFDVAGLNAYSTYAVSFIPTPGNAGGMEISSTLAFNAIAPEVAVYAVLVWRFLTYYIFILVGISLSIFDFIKKAIIIFKERRMAKRMEKNHE